MRPAKAVPAYGPQGAPATDMRGSPVMATGYYSWKQENAGAAYVECGGNGERQCNVQARPGPMSIDDLWLFRVPDPDSPRGTLYDGDLEMLASMLNETFVTWANVINKSRQFKGELATGPRYTDPLEVTFLPTDTGLELVWDRPTGPDPTDAARWRAAPPPDWQWR